MDIRRNTLRYCVLLRTGTRVFWTDEIREPPRLRLIETAPIALLLLVTVGLTVQAGPVMGYMDRTADALHAPDAYTRAVLSADKVARPTHPPQIEARP